MPNFATLELRTPRLRLRPLRDTDAPALFAICADPQTMRYWSTPAWSTPDIAEALIARDREAMAAGESLRLGLERLGDGGSAGPLIGHCSLFNLHPSSRRAETGYLLARTHWGRGLMHEALVALLSHGFGPLALHRIEADIDPRNLASARSLERLGFVREGLLRERWLVGDEVSDSALYGLLAREWAAR